MTSDLLFELAWKSVICAGMTLAVLGLLRNRSAAEKSAIAQIGMFALLLLPIASAALPSLEYSAPAPVVRGLDGLTGTFSPSPETLTSTTGGAEAAAFNWEGLLLGAYLIPAAVLLVLLLLGILRLHQLHSRAEVLVDARWLTALAAAQRRLRFKHGTALMMSKELNSPISWGVVRPVIIIDPTAAEAVDQAEAIIAHELAHVHRLDWLKLIIGRLAIALFWFNPLVWALARRSHQLCEEAADDAVIQTDISSTEYADLLVSAVRHANGSILLAANGVAPSRTSIAKRVRHVLDKSRRRTPAGMVWVATSLAAGLAFNGALAAAEPVINRAASTNSEAGQRAAEQLERIESPHTRTIAQAIKARDWHARRVVGPTTFHEPAAVEHLVDALRDSDPEVRRIAVWGLSEMRPTIGSEAAPPVALLLIDASPQVRGEAARALGDFGATEHAQAVAKLLEDPDPTVRVQAAHALGDLQSPATRGALERARTDPDPTVRSKAQWALQQVREAEEILRRYGNP